MKQYNLNGNFFSQAIKNGNNYKVSGEGWILVDDEVAESISDSVTKGGDVYLNQDGRLVITGRKSNPAAIWNFDTERWELDEAVQAKIEAQQFQDNRQALIRRLRQVAEQVGAPLVDEYPAIEVNSFPIQKEEARAYKAGTNQSPTFLSRLSKERGIPLDELVEKVLKKTALYETLTGAIAGKRQLIMDKIDAAKNQADLDAISKEIDAWSKAANAQ